MARSLSIDLRQRTVQTQQTMLAAIATIVLECHHMTTASTYAQSETPPLVNRVWKIAVVLLIALLVLIGLELFLISQMVFPGVRVVGQGIGGSPAAARSKIAAVAAGIPKTITVRAGTQTVTLERSSFAWRADVDATVRDAMTVGKRGSLIERARERWVALQSWVDLPLRASFDQAQLRSRLIALSEPFTVAPRNAKLVLKAGNYETSAERAGRSLDVQAALTGFANDPGSSTITLEPISVPAQLTGQTLEPIRVRANALLRPMTVRYAQGIAGAEVASLELLPQQVANLFFVKQDGFTPDLEAIRRSLTRFARTNDAAPQPARYVRRGDTLTVRSARPGYGLQLERAIESLATAVLDPKVREVSLPVGALEAQFGPNDLAALQALAVVAESTTNFAGSSFERMTNVRVAAAKLDGYTVLTDGVFDFNQAIGEISRENGYQGALIISGGRTVEGVGGGVCQVSTTAFRAFYTGGFPILERNPHAYKVRYYGSTLGIDAAVYQPSLNLRMRNDSGGPLLIRTAVNGTRLTVRIQGLPLERRVSIQSTVLSRTPFPPAAFEFNPRLPPGTRRQVDWSVDGYRVRVTRTISDELGVRSEVLATNYKPWRAVYQVGPKLASR